jgi:hypothetical protein
MCCSEIVLRWVPKFTQKGDQLPSRRFRHGVDGLGGESPPRESHSVGPRRTFNEEHHTVFNRTPTGHTSLSDTRSLLFAGLRWCTYYRCLRKHLKCHFLQIELNNWLMYILQQSIWVSPIAISGGKLIYLLLTRCCHESLDNSVDNPSETPRSTWKSELFKDGCGWGSRVRI